MFNIENLKFYHASVDLSNEVKRFIPGIPRFRCEHEDATINRVCVCTSLENAISAFPYKSIYINETMRKNKENYLTYYEIDSRNLTYKTDVELKDYVPDVHITKEHWILDEFEAKGRIIKVNKLRLCRYDKYNNEYYGPVDTLEFEESIADEDRDMTYAFIDKSFVNKAKKWAESNGIDYSILEDTHHHLGYRRFRATEKYCGTTKKYRYVVMQFNIPAGVDVSELWLINHSQNNYLSKKNIYAEPNKFDVSYYFGWY